MNVWSKHNCLCVCLALMILIGAVTGCSIFRREKGLEKIARKMLVTAYDAGQKSTRWEHKWGCCLLPPVYAYGPNKGKRKLVGITSDGSIARKGTIAADIARYPYGTKMYVPGYGWGEVHDKGISIQGDHIDVFFPNEDDANAWGKQVLEVIILKQ
ncbi:MAG: 3D domain-containing protein [Syntrophales bacterium]